MIAYLLIECDLHHGEARITNLGKHKSFEEAIQVGKEKVATQFDNYSKVIGIKENGLMVELESNELYGPYSNPIRVGSD